MEFKYSKYFGCSIQIFNIVTNSLRISNNPKVNTLYAFVKLAIKEHACLNIHRFIFHENLFENYIFF